MRSNSTRRTAKRRGLAPAFLFVPLYPLIYRRNNVLIHAFTSGSGSGLDFVLFPSCHSNRNTVKVCCVPFAVALFAGFCIFLRRQIHTSFLSLSVS
nr:MAG TPA: hypothetical protein [Bacteriophage sp.]